MIIHSQQVVVSYRYLKYNNNTKSKFITLKKQEILTKLYNKHTKKIITKRSYYQQSNHQLQGNMTTYKNITNGQISLNYDPQDKVSYDFKLIKSTPHDSLQPLKRDDPNIPVSYYIQNIRSGTFSQISQTHMKQTHQQKQEQQNFTVDSFQAEMHMLYTQLQNKLFKITTFFQGLFAGMSLLYTITLHLSLSISVDLVRFEDQCMRVLSLLSTLGALYSLLISKQKCTLYQQQFIDQQGKLTATSSHLQQLYKSVVLCLIQFIFYSISYVIYNVSHKSALLYNVNGTNYSELKSLTTGFTVITILGWIVTNTNTYKYENKS